MRTFTVSLLDTTLASSSLPFTSYSSSTSWPVSLSFTPAIAQYGTHSLVFTAAYAFDSFTYSTASFSLTVTVIDLCNPLVFTVPTLDNSFYIVGEPMLITQYATGFSYTPATGCDSAVVYTATLSSGNALPSQI